MAVVIQHAENTTKIWEQILTLKRERLKWLPRQLEQLQGTQPAVLKTNGCNQTTIKMRERRATPTTTKIWFNTHFNLRYHSYSIQDHDPQNIAPATIDRAMILPACYESDSQHFVRSNTQMENRKVPCGKAVIFSWKVAPWRSGPSWVQRLANRCKCCVCS